MSRPDGRPARGPRSFSTPDRDARGQTAVVGVALLLAITVLAVGGLTATAGSIVDDGATAAAATRVSADFATALGPAPTAADTTIGLTDGTIRVVNRSVWLLRGEEIVWAGHAGAIVYADGDHRVTGFAGAVVRSDGAGSRMVAPSRIAPAEGSLYVGVPVLNATGADGIATGDRRLAVTLRTDAETVRDTLPADEYRVAVETRDPAAWERHFADRGAVTARRDVDGDGVPSVVASFEGPRTVHLIVHDIGLDVGVGR